MQITREAIEAFLRGSIFVCLVALMVMLIVAIFEFESWPVLLPGIISCTGVIVSFGVHLNRLHGHQGTRIATAG